MSDLERQLADANARIAELEAERDEWRDKFSSEFARGMDIDGDLVDAKVQLRDARAALNRVAAPLSDDEHDELLTWLDTGGDPAEIIDRFLSIRRAADAAPAPLPTDLCRCGHAAEEHKRYGCSHEWEGGDTQTFCSCHQFDAAPVPACEKCGHAVASPDGCSECPDAAPVEDGGDR